jgi:hypothetical protein
MTNLEKLQSLDVKDFANILDGEKLACNYCLYHKGEFSDECSIVNCKQGIVEWLESECVI